MPLVVEIFFFCKSKISIDDKDKCTFTGLIDNKLPLILK